jgi:hypothetical protein
VIAVRYQFDQLIALLVVAVHDKIFLVTAALTMLVGSIMLIAGAAYDAVIELAGIAIYAGLREALAAHRSRHK